MLAPLLIFACLASQTATSTDTADEHLAAELAPIPTRVASPLPPDIEELFRASTEPTRTLGNAFLIGAGGGAVVSVGIGAISYFGFARKLGDGALRSRDD